MIFGDDFSAVKTSIVNAETGEALEGVIGYTIHGDASKFYTRITLEMACPAFDCKGSPEIDLADLKFVPHASAIAGKT